jgi:hypothetical protein
VQKFGYLGCGHIVVAEHMRDDFVEKRLTLKPVES